MNFNLLFLFAFFVFNISQNKPYEVSDILKNETVKSIGFLQTNDQIIKEDFNKLIPIYDKPNGSQFSEIKLTVMRGLSSHYVFTPKDADLKQIQKYSRHLVIKHIAQYYNLGKGQVLTKFYNIKDGYVKILTEQFDNYWIKLSDIDQYVKPTTYAEFLAQHTLFEIAGYQNYRLRKGPSLQDEIIIKLNANYYHNKPIHIITEFKQVEGSWAYVVVYEINKYIDECYGKDDVMERWTGNIYEGWIKLVDNDGHFEDIYFKSC